MDIERFICKTIGNTFVHRKRRWTILFQILFATWLLWSNNLMNVERQDYALKNGSRLLSNVDDVTQHIWCALHTLTKITLIKVPVKWTTIYVKFSTDLIVRLDIIQK